MWEKTRNTISFLLLFFVSHLQAGSLPAYEMVPVPAGQFVLSIPINDSVKLKYVDKTVVFKNDFHIGKYEVSNALWNQCYKEKFCRKKALQKNGEGDNHPVARINWHDAHQFTKWYSKKSKKLYRLPTEEEWTYAMNMGKNYKELEYSYDYESFGIWKVAIKTTRPQGSMSENAWKIFDLKGNVWEWTLTCWYGSKENMMKQVSATELNSPKACTTRIAQGESRSHIPDFISDTYNGGCSTLRPAANLGFRMVTED